MAWNGWPLDCCWGAVKEDGVLMPPIILDMLPSECAYEGREKVCDGSSNREVEAEAEGFDEKEEKIIPLGNGLNELSVRPWLCLVTMQPKYLS